MKELIEKLKAGVIYYDSHYLMAIDEDETNELMAEAAEKLEELSKKWEQLSNNKITEDCPYRIDAFKSTFFEGARYAEKQHKIGIGNELY